MTHSYLVNYLAQQDIPCPGCGYNLRGLTGEHCPECGQALVLRVGLAEPRAGRFVAALISLATGLGFNLFVFLWGFFEMRSGGIAWSQLWSLALFSVILGVATGMLVRHRRWLRELPTPGACIVIGGCAVLSVVSVAVFLSIVE